MGSHAGPADAGRYLRLFCVAALAAGCSGVAAQRAPAPSVAIAAGRIAADDLMPVVSELAAPRYAGRRTGSEGGVAARNYIRAAFNRIGLEPAGTSGFDQPFRFREYNDAANLLGRVSGRDAAAGTFVITAHYDHLGVRNGATYHGADDNASGIAALLAVARAVKAQPLRHTAIFAALDAEELGLEGAKALVARPPVPLSAVALNVNFDMLSRSDRQEIFAAGTHHYPWLRPILEDVQRRAAVRLRFGHDLPGSGDDDWTLQSDHGVFHRAGVPFVYFGVEDHPDYHRPTDTAGKIDPAFFSDVVAMALDAIVTMDRRIERPRSAE